MSVRTKLRLWSLTRHPTVTLHALQQACPSLRRATHNKLARIASGDLTLRALSAPERRDVLAALVRLGLARRGDAPAWLEPLGAGEERRLRRVRSHGAVRADRIGAGAAAFRRFSNATVGAGCWDFWKKETRVGLTQDVLDHFSLKADPFTKPREAADRWTCAALERAEKQLRASILRGEAVMLKGASGSGKTALARNVTRDLVQREKIVLSRYLPPDTRNIREHSLCAGIAMDLSDKFSLGQRQPSSALVAMRRIAEGAKQCAARNMMLLVLLEEAHYMRELIGKLLKRIQESVMDGYEERLAVLLIGQTDDSAKADGGRPLDLVLSDANNREWVERLTVIDVPPLGGSLQSYVAFRFERKGGDAAKALGDGWAPAVRRALPPDRLVPQAVDKLLSDAMRLAVRLQDKRVEPAHIESVARGGARPVGDGAQPEEVAA